MAVTKIYPMSYSFEEEPSLDYNNKRPVLTIIGSAIGAVVLIYLAISNDIFAPPATYAQVRVVSCLRTIHYPVEPNGYGLEFTIPITFLQPPGSSDSYRNVVVNVTDPTDEWKILGIYDPLTKGTPHNRMTAEVYIQYENLDHKYVHDRIPYMEHPVKAVFTWEEEFQGRIITKEDKVVYIIQCPYISPLLN